MSKDKLRDFLADEVYPNLLKSFKQRLFEDYAMDSGTDFADYIMED